MASSINASTSPAAIIQTADGTANLNLQSNGSTVLALTSGGVAVTGTMTVGGNAVLNAGSVVTIAQGGTNNASLAVTAGGVVYTDGSKLVNVGAGTANQILQSNGASAPTWVNASAGGLGGTTVFTADGTFTIPSGKTVVKVTVVGGGGAGGTGSGGDQVGAGGGGGGAAIKYLTGLTPGNTLTVTRGAAASTSSVASGTQTITTISATGGSVGESNQYNIALGGTGGSGTNGDYNIQGQKGNTAQAFYADDGNNYMNGGLGGDSILGFGGIGAAYFINTGLRTAAFAGQNYGSGGGGGNAQSTPGGAGAIGIVIFEY